MTEASKSSRRRVILAPAAVLLVLVGVGLWLVLREGPEAPPAAPEPQEVVQAPPAPRPRATPPPAPPPVPQPDAKKLELEYASDGKPYMPPGPEYPQPNTFAHPHPITEKHKKLFKENSYIYQLNEAMDGKEVPRLRKLLKQYKDEYPEDNQDMQKGYALIADCLEFPGDAAIRARADAYFKTEIASTLRRFVMRHCLN